MKLRVMASNIWGDYFGNEVTRREDQLFDVYMRYSPDVIGMQEATKTWYGSKLFERLKEKYVFTDVSAYVQHNFDPLLYDKTRFNLVDCGFVKYDDTPDPSKAVNWAVLEDKESGKRFAVMSTHFWWKVIGDPEHDALRVSNARQLNECGKNIKEKYGCPVIAFGDFNSYVSSPCMQFLYENGWRETQDCAKIADKVSTHHGDPVRGEDGFYHGKPTANGSERSIDHIIFLGDVDPLLFRVVEDQDALDATDHSPIFADFEI